MTLGRASIVDGRGPAPIRSDVGTHVVKSRSASETTVLPHAAKRDSREELREKTHSWRIDSKCVGGQQWADAGRLPTRLA
jgi:hypothetical protein